MIDSFLIYEVFEHSEQSVKLFLELIGIINT